MLRFDKAFMKVDGELVELPLGMSLYGNAQAWQSVYTADTEILSGDTLSLPAGVYDSKTDLLNINQEGIILIPGYQYTEANGTITFKIDIKQGTKICVTVVKFGENNLDIVEDKIAQVEASVPDINTLFKIADCKNFFVGGSGATDEITDGIGESADRPFSSLQACLTHLSRNFSWVDNVNVVLQSDINESAVKLAYIGYKPITIKSDGTKRAINGMLTVDSTALALQNVTLQGLHGVGRANISATGCTFNIPNGQHGIELENMSYMFVSGAGFQVASGTAGNAIRVTEGSVLSMWGANTFNGAYTAVINAQIGGIFYIGANLTSNTMAGSATGSRYAMTKGARIFVNGRGASAIPGSAAGTTDSSCIYM